jgi:hypothetical protein
MDKFIETPEETAARKAGYTTRRRREIREEEHVQSQRDKRIEQKKEQEMINNFMKLKNEI